MPTAQETINALLARWGGGAPGAVMPGPAAAPAYGTQENPLDAFVIDGRTGNKTTNKDLPEWLRRAGMKGDAYAGGMLKPELRYGFMFKGGKIFFADGTSYAAKKGKGGTYTYTDASGAKQTYDPTDEQDAYNKRYKKATTGFFDNFTNSLDPTSHASPFGEAGLMFDPIYHATGGDEGGYAKLMRQTWEKPNEWASPYVKKFNVVDRELNPMHAAADKTDAGMWARNMVENKPGDTALAIFGAAGLSGIGGGGGAAGGGSGAGGGASAYGPWSSGYVAPGASSSVPGLTGISTGGAGSGVLAGGGGAAGGSGGLGVFAGGGAAGISGVGGGNAGALASSGAISNGAGTAGGLIGGGAGGGSMAGGGSWMNTLGEWLPTLISAGSSIIGSRQANDAMTEGSRAALAETGRQFDLVRGDTAPQRALGNAAIAELAALYGFDDGSPDPSRFQASPEHSFNLAEGQQAIDRSAAARGGLLSGAAVKEGQRYASGLASRESSAFVDRLLQAAGVGATGIGASAAAGAQSANNVAGIQTNLGNNRASIYLNNAANVNNAVQTGYSNQLLRRYLGEPS